MQHPTNRLIRIREVTKLTGLSKSYIYQLTKTNQFPKQISLVKGGTSVAWLESEVNDWIKSRVQDRNINN
jgi:prophage regulatory protein